MIGGSLALLLALLLAWFLAQLLALLLAWSLAQLFVLSLASSVIHGRWRLVVGVVDDTGSLALGCGRRR